VYVPVGASPERPRTAGLTMMPLIEGTPLRLLIPVTFSATNPITAADWFKFGGP